MDNLFTKNTTVYDRVKIIEETKTRLRETLQREPTQEEVYAEIGAKEEVVKPYEILEIDEDQEHDLELLFKVGAVNMNLRKAREAKGLLQRDLAKMLGVSGAVIGQLETCRTFAKPDRQKRIAEILEKPVSYLFPPWLELFTHQWKRTEKQKSVTIKHDQLSSPDVKMLTDPNHCVEEMNNKARIEVMKPKIREMISRLTPREQKILDMRFGLTDGVSHTLEEIGQEFGVTRDRIRQIEGKALQNIQNMEEIKCLRDND